MSNKDRPLPPSLKGMSNNSNSNNNNSNSNNNTASSSSSSSSSSRHVPLSLQEQFAQRRKRRKRNNNKHEVRLRSSNDKSNEEQQRDHPHNNNNILHNSEQATALLFHEQDLEQHNGDTMPKVDRVKDLTGGEPNDNPLLVSQKDTKTNHHAHHETTTLLLAATHPHHASSSLFVDNPSREPSHYDDYDYETLQRQQEQSQQASLLVSTTSTSTQTQQQRQQFEETEYYYHREQSQREELETIRGECKQLVDQLTTTKAELQIQKEKYSNLKEKYYKWYHFFLKVWAEKFRNNETMEPPPGIPNVSTSPRRSRNNEHYSEKQDDQHPVVTPSTPWANQHRTESSSASIKMMGPPKRLSSSLRDSKETADSSTEDIDSLTRVHKVDSSVTALSPSACKVDNQETLSRGISNGGIFGNGDKRASHNEDSPLLDTEESNDAGSCETHLNGPLPEKKSTPPDEHHSMEPKRVPVSLREPDSKTTMPRGTLKVINEYWEKKTSGVNTPARADELNDAGSETQLNGPPSPETQSTSPPIKTIEANRLSAGNEPIMIHGTWSGGVGASDNKRSRVSSPMGADGSDDVWSQTRLNGPSRREKGSYSPANKSTEPKRLSTSLREADSKETTTGGGSKKTVVDSKDEKAWRVDSPTEADEWNDASSEAQHSDPSPLMRSKSPASKTVEPKWLTSSLRKRSHKETMTRGILKTTVNSRDNASPTTFDGPDDAGSETQLNGPEKPSNVPAKKPTAHKRVSASLDESDRKETVTSESLKKCRDKETSQVDSAEQPDEMDDETQLNGPSPEKRIRLEKVGAESTSFGSHQTLEKSKETGIDSSPVHEGSEMLLVYHPSAHNEKKGTEGKELAFSNSFPSNSGQKSDKVSSSTGTKAVQSANNVSNSHAKVDADNEDYDPSQALFSQLSEAPILRQSLGRARPTPRTLKDRTNMKPASVRRAVSGWTCNVVARNFVQSVSTTSAEKKSPVKEERNPASILSPSIPSVEKKPPLNEERKPAFVPSMVTAPETEATNQRTGTMQPPWNPYAAQRPSVAKASSVSSSISASRASTSKLLYEDSEDNYRYQEVVRCKHDRQNLPGHECPQCSNWVDSICHGDGGKVFNRKELMDCSRHRAAHSPENTPEGFWELSFADEIEARKRFNEHFASAEEEDSESDEI